MGDNTATQCCKENLQAQAQHSCDMAGLKDGKNVHENMEIDPCWVVEILYGNNVFCRASQVNEDREQPLFGITLTDGLEQKEK